MNIHRWRKLEATDSSTYDLMTKIQSIQKDLRGKKEGAGSVIEREIAEVPAGSPEKAALSVVIEDDPRLRVNSGAEVEADLEHEGLDLKLLIDHPLILDRVLATPKIAAKLQA